MSKFASLSRRKFIRAGIVASGGVIGAAALAGCGETQIVEVIKEVPVDRVVTQIVEKVVVQEKIVERIVTAEAMGPKEITGTIEYWDWWNPTSGIETKNWFEWLKKDFEAQNPSAKIEFQFIPFGNEYVQKFQAAAAAGNPPDIMHSSIVWGRDFFDLGTLDTFNDFVKTDPEMAMSKFLDGALFYNQKEGKIYGIPMEGPDSRVLFWDKAALLDAGLDPSFEAIWEWTWDDFRENSLKLTQRDGDEITRAGFLVAILGMEFLATWMHTQGGGFYNSDQTALALRLGEAKKAIEFNLQLLNEDKVSLPLGPERQDFQQFLQGKTAMVSGGIWAIARVRNGAPDKNFDLGPYPEGPGGSGPATTTWHNMVVMPKKGKNKEGAWRWAQYYAGLQSFKDRVRIMSRFAPRKALYVSDEWNAEVKREPLLPRVPRIADVGGAYPFIRYTETNSIFTPLIEAMFVQDADIDETLAEIEAQANPLLQKAGGA